MEGNMSTIWKRKIIKYFVFTSALTIPFIYLSHLIVGKYISKKRKELEAELEVDVLKINRCLSLGVESKSKCDCVDVFCSNMQCNIGKLCYILRLVENSNKTLDVCIYFLSANVFGEAILKAHRKGVRVRVIADISNTRNRNSWIFKFLEEGIPVRQKVSDNLMHHKFLIVDNEIVVNGSMNFTLCGAFSNWEMVLVSSQPSLVKQFSNGFQKLWDSFDNHLH
ncbi:hypothetical protein O3M35_001397 [Rhynocoris fuscipes]|uniref:Mitochondrial cardiolipin hydrolase n=1 Tax=Rhynocoris fuscipes TaxID=488301 RepID=A0AAW1CNT4_9HEMI